MKLSWTTRTGVSVAGTVTVLSVSGAPGWITIAAICAVMGGIAFLKESKKQEKLKEVQEKAQEQQWRNEQEAARIAQERERERRDSRANWIRWGGGFIIPAILSWLSYLLFHRMTWWP